MAPIKPPIKDDVKAAPSASYGLPCFASGCPSTIVACEEAVPGTPSNIELKESEIDVTAKEEAIRANACEGSTKAKKGNNIKIQVTPLNPGIKPDSKPTTKPKIIKTK